MQTKILTINQIDEAVALLKSGEIVALPTETVYGLAADATNVAAIAKIFAAKNRPSDHPLIVHIDTLAGIHDWIEFFPENAQKLAQAFWPGPLTMVFIKKNNVPNSITGGNKTVAIRIPNHPIFIQIIEKLGNGIVAPSANAYQKTSPSKAEHVLKTLDTKIAAVLDGGQCTVGIESTIIDMTHEIPVILRPGAITGSMIEKVLGMKIEFPVSHTQKMPGNMQVHYQPEKPLFLFSEDDLEKYSHNEHNIAVMHHSNITQFNHVIYYPMPRNKTEYAQKLYETLHTIDTTDVTKIFVETPPHSPEWSDIHDRLIKASTKLG